MGAYYLPLILLLLVAAAFVRDDFVFTLFYLFAAVYLVGRWWAGRAMQAVRFKRVFDRHAFPGESVTVQLTLKNTGWLPVVWLQLAEGLPVELAGNHLFREVTSLEAKGKKTFTYTLQAKHRGYYRVGPLTLSSGDLLGLTPPVSQRGAEDYLIVYPRVIALRQMRLPSRTPMGRLKDSQPLFEDPTRAWGKREYVAGDSLRRVDWKASATTGRLQVKQFEPSISLETLIVLDMHEESYALRERIWTTEFAITTAASVATWLSARQQAVGLGTNGTDPLQPDHPCQPLRPRKGRAHLMRTLETLARVQRGAKLTLEEMLPALAVRLAWGTTLVLITGRITESLFDPLFIARRTGLNAIILGCGQVGHAGLRVREVEQRASYFHIPFHHLRDELDLDIWRI